MSTVSSHNARHPNDMHQRCPDVCDSCPARRWARVAHLEMSMLAASHLQEVLARAAIGIDAL